MGIKHITSILLLTIFGIQEVKCQKRYFISISNISYSITERIEIKDSTQTAFFDVFIKNSSDRYVYIPETKNCYPLNNETFRLSLGFLGFNITGIPIGDGDLGLRCIPPAGNFSYSLKFTKPALTTSFKKALINIDFIYDINLSPSDKKKSTILAEKYYKDAIRSTTEFPICIF